jgi:hypothetical protein
VHLRLSRGTNKVRLATGLNERAPQERISSSERAREKSKRTDRGPTTMRQITVPGASSAVKSHAATIACAIALPITGQGDPAAELMRALAGKQADRFAKFARSQNTACG